MKINMDIKWNTIDWKKVKKIVWKFQVRIYKLTKQGKFQNVYNLQKILLRRLDFKLLAVRKITQDNRDERKKDVNNLFLLSSRKRIELARSVRIEKKNKIINRLKVPLSKLKEDLLQDYIKQILILGILEPQFEAISENHSYGFRPGKSEADAVQTVWNALKITQKYVLDCSVLKSFNCVNSQHVLKKLNTIPIIEQHLRIWFKYIIIDNIGINFPQEKISFKHIISPFLLNVIFHGLENFIMKYVESRKGLKNGKGKSISLSNRCSSTLVVRYGAKFIVISPYLELVEEILIKIKEWLCATGLNLDLKKTKIVHTLYEFKTKKAGFDFLGFSIKQYLVSKYKKGKFNKVFKVFITPNRESIKRHKKQIKQILQRTKCTKNIIKQLNRTITTWCNYYKGHVSSKVFVALRHDTFRKLWKWVLKKYPREARKKLYKLYWKNFGQDRLRFGYFNKEKKWVSAKEHIDTKIKRHIKVMANRSPYDGDLIYWAKRHRKFQQGNNIIVQLFNQQKMKCARCHFIFHYDDIIEVDHIVSKRKGGQDQISNLQLLHGHCHDLKLC